MNLKLNTKTPITIKVMLWRLSEFFKSIKKVKFEGKDSDNPLAFKYYNPQQKVGKKTMESHLRFAVAYWHTFCGTGADPFGAPTKIFP